MKKIIYIIPLIAVLFSCERYIDYIPEDDSSKLILNANLNTADSVHIAYVSYSAYNSLESIDGAIVTMYVNDKLVASSDDNAELNSKLSHAGKYYLNAKFAPGDKVKLVAKYNSLTAWAEVTAPEPVELTSVEKKDIDEDSPSTFIIKFNDRSGENNFYRIAGLKYGDVYVQDTLATKRRRYTDIDFDCTSDLIVMEGNVVKKKSEDDDTSIVDDLIGTYTNTYNTFSDTMFEDKECTIEGKASPWIMLDSYGYTSHDKVEIYNYFEVRLITMSEDEFRYIRTIDNMENGNWFNTFTFVDPVAFPNNVQDGLGCVFASSASVYTIKEHYIIQNP